MLVRATQRGFFADTLREPGSTFMVSDPAAFAAEWMEKVDEDPEPEAAPAPKKAKAAAVEAEQI